MTAQIDRLPLATGRPSPPPPPSSARRSSTAELVEALLEGPACPFDREASRRLDEFLEAEGPGPTGSGTGLIRDTAYEALPFPPRRQLHAHAATHSASSLGADADAAAELLSMPSSSRSGSRDAWKFSSDRQQARAGAKFAERRGSSILERAVDRGGTGWGEWGAGGCLSARWRCWPSARCTSSSGVGRVEGGSSRQGRRAAAGQSRFEEAQVWLLRESWRYRNAPAACCCASGWS